MTARGTTTWRVATIRSILSNEKYTGNAALQGACTVDFLTKSIKLHQRKVAQYYVTGCYEPFNDPEVWDQVQYELATG
ncbi:recombinase family protein [Cutibacterium porci]|uniref:recombinase family protein n=1 Tax=Cutibacterium porci TaxID=2605781 RepID=UPI0012B40D50